METVEEKQQQQSTTTDDPLVKISIPSEVIEDILTSLPVKSILRFKSVSKPWLSLISTPSFTKLHFTRSTRTALFISAYDHSTRQQHLLSAPRDGGPVSHLLTIDDASVHDITEAQHLNGLVLFSSVKLFSAYNHDKAFLLNPSTHKFFKLPDPCIDRKGRVSYLFGFDESRNEHKVLMIRQLRNPTTYEIRIFSMSTYSWRKIDAEPPVGFSWDRLGVYINISVCVNSVIHLMCRGDLSFPILAFDLRTEMFSVINTPQVSTPDEDPCIIKINGCISVVFFDYNRVMENNEMHIWILQDYENHVWVKETIAFTEPWAELGYPFPRDSVNMDEIIFCSTKMSGNVTSLLVYNKISRSFKSLQFTSGHQFPFSRALRFSLAKCYVESMMTL
ncbi:putative F-box domain-containing protein [Helianthus annuus]|nr:putative F-box domain-containing protein [Helianthus annuus]